jgi:hypothetical protein
MRRVPSCLLFTAFVSSFLLLTAAEASAGFRAGASAHRGGRLVQSHRQFVPHRALGHGRIARPHASHRRLHAGRGGFWSSAGFGYPASTLLVQAEGPAAPAPAIIGIPSLSDLPISTGIRSTPASQPTVYVLDDPRRSAWRGRMGATKPQAKVVSLGEHGPVEQAEADSGGPRIIHLRPRER